MASMIEEHLSWSLLWRRATYPDIVFKGYQFNMQSALNSRRPYPISKFCYKFIFGHKCTKKAHGIGIHTQDEIIEFGKSDLCVLLDLLRDEPEICGNERAVGDEKGKKQEKESEDKPEKDKENEE